MDEVLSKAIDDFLAKAKKTEYWRAVELHKELIGPGNERLMEIKELLERKVDAGRYERTIVTKKKITQVGYRSKLERQEITEDDVGKVEDILGSDWERKKQ